MPSEEQFDDVVAEIRARHQGCENCDLSEMTSGDLLILVDRLLEAHKREINELRKTLKGDGDAK